MSAFSYDARVMPYHACTGCGRGDTFTAVAAEGDVPFVVAVIVRLLDVDVDEGYRILQTMWADGREAAWFSAGAVQVFEPDMEGDHTIVVRLCPDCAAKTDVQVGSLSEGSIPCFRQSEMRQ